MGDESGVSHLKGVSAKVSTIIYHGVVEAYDCRRGREKERGRGRVKSHKLLYSVDPQGNADIECWEYSLMDNS
jgi:hypothetical protein